MRTPNWWQDAVMYELYVDKFAGNFRGLTERLPYFERLGVNCLNILPHYPSPMIDDGYDISDYRNVRPELGTMGDFKRFTEVAHARGIYVLVDLVLNHVSAEHPWFVSARASKDNLYRNFFLWSTTGVELRDSCNPFVHAKPSNWVKNEQTEDFYYATFFREQPDLNWDEPRVFEEMCAVMDFWIDTGVDAFRFDAAPHLMKVEGTYSRSLPETHELLKRIRARLDSRHEHIAILAEVQDTPEQSQGYFGNDDECHMLYNFQLALELVMSAYDNHPITLNGHMTASPTPSHCTWVNFLRNHDALALFDLSEEDRVRFLSYTDPSKSCLFHGGHALSMRLASIFAHEPKKIRTAFELLFATPGTPVIYYGEEIGMKNDETIGAPADTRRYVRGTFDWAEAEKQTRDPDSLFNFVASQVHGRLPRSRPTR